MFSRYCFTLVATTGFLAAFLPTAGDNTSAANAAPPNIVVILADDLGIGDASCYNADSKIPMPVLNQLAREGMRFTDVHTPSSVCSPTRYALLTGRYAWRSRLKKGVLWGYSRSLLEPGRPTLASMLKSKGYATGCFGKWHLGFQSPDLSAKDLPDASRILPGDHPHAVDYSQPLTPGPVTVGFDTFFGIPSSLDMEPYVFVKDDRPVQQPTARTAKSLHRRQNGEGFWRAGPIGPDFKHIDVLPKVVENAREYIADQDGQTPFFMYVPLPAPHTPWMPTPEFRNKTDVGYYGDFVVQVDHSIGQILAALKEQKFADNTLVIVTSDNGSHWPEGDITKWKHDANAGYRGQKADIHEGGHRVPFLVRWPGVVAAGSVDNGVHCLTDVFATLADVVDYQLPEVAAEDSFSLLQELKGKKTSSPRAPVIHHSANGTFAIRDGNTKLIAGLGSGGFTRPSVIKPEPDGPKVQLYDLAVDRNEKTNLALEHPELVKRLQKKLQELQNAGRSR